MDEKTKKRMRVMLITMGILFGTIFIYKGVKSLMLGYFMSQRSQAVTVSAIQIDYDRWQETLEAVGSLRAMQGVNVTTELAGMVKTIYFTPGATVNKDDLLVQLNTDTETAQLQVLVANAEIAKTIYHRDKAQFAVRAISKAVLDVDAANAKSTQAQVTAQETAILEKTIRAPFSGRLGISAVNPGQYVNPGDKVVTLQQLDPIYVDFFVPQQQLEKIRLGQTVTLTIDTFPGQTFTGKVTTVNPIIDVNTRNVEIEATIANPKLQLVPGMFALVKMQVGEPKYYLTLPQSAISFNSYGDIVFLIKESEKNWRGQSHLIVSQRFVTTGKTRGDQVAVLKGLKKGDRVVTSGQLKLKNGSVIAINNSVVPANNPVPIVSNES